MATGGTYEIAVLPGDGVGPDVARSAVKVLAAAAEQHELEVRFAEHLVGGAAIEASGDPLPEDTLEACKAADAVLLGAVGGPQWDTVDPTIRPERGLLRLRKELGVFANLRPVDAEDIDVLIVRELTGGIYFGRPSGRAVVDGIETAHDTMVYSRPEIERVAKVAFDWARRRRGKVTSVDKANVLETSRLWREVVSHFHATEYPDTILVHEYVDIAAMKLVAAPGEFDVVLTGNLFGDILSDLAASLPGSIGLLPSASIGESAGLFEPVHGSAPDIAALGVANPVGAILSAGMLLDYLGEAACASSVRGAVSAALRDGAVTKDLVPEGTPYLRTTEMTEAVVSGLETSNVQPPTSNMAEAI